jgi:hypothetical protein
MPIVRLCFGCVFLLSSCLFSLQERADFLVFKDPSGLSLLDKYQERLSKKAMAAFVPLCPLRIIDTAVLLSDQITPALKFGFKGEIFFLLKDGKSGFVGDKGATNWKSFKGCPMTGDTVEIVKDKVISFSREFPPAGGKEFLRKGETVVRLFQVRNQYGILKQVPGARYGFSGPMPAGAWLAIKKTEVRVDVSIDAGEYHKIAERLAAANASYRAFFNRFNQITGEARSTPSWSWEKSAGEVRCVLNGPAANGEALKASTQYIARDLENIFIGKPVDVSLTDNRIFVRPRGAGK